MEPVINWKETYTDTKYRKVLTAEHLKIPGLMLFGREIRTAATASLPPHFHENCYELVYLTSGTSSFSVAGKTYNLSGGDVFLTQPDQVHSTGMIPVTISEMYWMQFSFSDCGHTFHLDDVAAALLQEQLQHLPSPKISTSGSSIEHLFHAAFELLLSGGNAFLASQYLSLALSLILDFSEKTVFKLTPDIGWTMNYILDHITEQLSLEKIAQGAYLSTSQFKQKFKQQVGISPRQFINAQKIEYAKTLLEEGSSVEQTANQLGFTSCSYFITVFKKYNSCTPMQYLHGLAETERLPGADTIGTAPDTKQDSDSA